MYISLIFPSFVFIFCWIKLSDFGLAVTHGTQNRSNFKLSGTLGYVAPEYLLDGKPTKVQLIRASKDYLIIEYRMA